jgi:TPR repeat protein
MPKPKRLLSMKNIIIKISLVVICLPLIASAGSPQNSGLKALKRMAEAGDASAQYRLGRMYENGNGMAQSAFKAVERYRKAAEQNFAQGQYALGRMYAAGEGVRQDYSQAIRCFLNAAAQGNPLAQNRLGVMYENGQGIETNLVEAYKWYALAAGENQNVYGAANRDTLARRLTAEQIAEGQRRTWKAPSENTTRIAGK